jgi:ubiquinone/menaquinone biosynthesis C-methylase UbiE
MEYQNHVEHYKIDGEYYDYFTFDKFMKVEITRRYEEFLYFGSPKTNTTILDIGSGGGITTLLQERDVFYFPFDLSDINLRRIKVLSTDKTYPVNGDAFHLPFKKESVDLIMMSEIVEHLANPLDALKEAVRVLESNGKLIVSVPYKEKISYQICIHCNKPTPTHSHLHTFTVDKFKELLIQAGLNPIKFSKNMNKVTNRLHINYYLKSIPFRFWKPIDSLFNLMIDKPTSMIFVCKK